MGPGHTCDHYDLWMGNDDKERNLCGPAGQSGKRNTIRRQCTSQVRVGRRPDDSREPSFNLAFVLSCRVAAHRIICAVKLSYTAVRRITSTADNSKCF